MNVLLSIKPEFGDKILSGEKEYEFRKTCFKQPSRIQTVLLYSTAPVQQIIGQFSISEIIEDTPEILWQRFGNRSGTSKEHFLDYFSDHSTGYAFEIGEVNELENSVDPREVVEDFHPPVSFYYINGEYDQALAKQG